jgi:hypothetical protein
MLETIVHTNLYRVSWMKKEHQFMVSKQFKVEFNIGSYKDEVLCDFIPMDVFHVFWGRPWKYDRNIIHDGRKNTYSLERNWCRHMLFPLEDKGAKEEDILSIILMSGKEIFKEVNKYQEMNFSIIGKPRDILTNTSMNNLPVEIQELLNEFFDIMVDELPHILPPIRSISHHIDLIPNASFPNKSTYRLTP